MKYIVITIIAASIGGAALGTFMKPGGLGLASERDKQFASWCTKPTDEIIAWGAAYNERKGKKSVIGEGLLARGAFWNACNCMAKRIPDTLSLEETVFAGKVHGLHIKMQFQKFADKSQREVLRVEAQTLMKDNQAILASKPEWAKDLTRKFRECQKIR